MNFIISSGQLLGGIGLFLLGMTLMADGLKLAAGHTLKPLLERWTNTATRGLLAGTLLTAMVQSSSAVTVATIGFVNAGILTLERSVWVIFGSNLGTTMTAWLVALVGFKIKIELFALPAIGIGMFMRLIGPDTRRGALGQAIAGFGLFFIGISILRDAFTDVATTIDVAALATSGFVGIVIFVGLGFLMTLITQSSSAAISIALAAAAGHLIDLEPAAAMVIGANIGTTSTALLASMGATPNAKRVAAAHIAFNVLTGLVAILILPIMLKIVTALQDTLNLSPDVATALALFHTIFNILGIALIWPLTKPLVTRLKAHFISREEDLGHPRFLDKNALVMPSLALESLILELARLQDISVSIVATALAPLPSAQQALRPRLNVVETLSRHIGEYASRIYRSELPQGVSEALMHPYRALQHFEEIARIGADLPRLRGERPALGEESERLLDTYIATVAAELKRMTTPEPMPESWSPKTARANIRKTYTALKKSMLIAGAGGEIPFDHLEQTIHYIDHIHACGVRAIKAERRLRLIRAAAQGLTETDDAQSKPTDDG